MIVNVGETTALSCLSFNKVIWFHLRMNSNPIFKSNPLFLPQTSSKDHGYYYCYGTYKNKKHFIAKGNLKVYGKFL